MNRCRIQLKSVARTLPVAWQESGTALAVELTRPTRPENGWCRCKPLPGLLARRWQRGRQPAWLLMLGQPLSRWSRGGQRSDRNWL